MQVTKDVQHANIVLHKFMVVHGQNKDYSGSGSDSMVHEHTLMLQDDNLLDALMVNKQS